MPGRNRRARPTLQRQVTTTDGPFSEAKEVIGGLAILQANSKRKLSNRSNNSFT
jgi:hypothetical protein